jgi:hypothetical protein
MFGLLLARQSLKSLTGFLGNHETRADLSCTKRVRDQCGGKHDIIDVLMSLPVLMLRVRQPSADNFLAKRFILQELIKNLL